MADVESKSIPHELPSSHWLKATGQCVLERYLSATMNSQQYERDTVGHLETMMHTSWFLVPGSWSLFHNP